MAQVFLPRGIVARYKLSLLSPPQDSHNHPRQPRRTHTKPLVVEVGGELETVRVYDGAHGRNELHRHSRSAGKQSAQIVHYGSLGEGMRAAIKDVQRGYESMIESWRAR